MVEMAIILPILLLVMFAIAEMGLLFNRWLTLSNAAREGARHAIVYRDNCVAGIVKTEITNRVLDFAEAGAIQRNDVAVAFSNNEIADNVCAGSGTQVLVRASIDFPFLYIPGLGALRSPGILPGSLNVGHSAVMRNE
ncbi:MAG: TadE family protein [Myxococcota bacterium]